MMTYVLLLLKCAASYTARLGPLGDVVVQSARNANVDISLTPLIDGAAMGTFYVIPEQKYVEVCQFAKG